jgi:hypothetical protein
LIVMQSFVYNALPGRVIFGHGTVSALKAEIERAGCTRALLLSTPEQAAALKNIATPLVASQIMAPCRPSNFLSEVISLRCRPRKRQRSQSLPLLPPKSDAFDPAFMQLDTTVRLCAAKIRDVLDLPEKPGDA